MNTRIVEVLNTFPEITFALLFGSYAKGAQTDLSDIDIGIYTDSCIDIFRQGEIITTMEYALNKKIDLVVLNELYKSNARLSFNIADSHILLLCKEKEKYVDFKSYSLLYYFDISPMYEMFDKSLKERLANGTYGKTKAS